MPCSSETTSQNLAPVHENDRRINEHQQFLTRGLELNRTNLVTALFDGEKSERSSKEWHGCSAYLAGLDVDDFAHDEKG